MASDEDTKKKKGYATPVLYRKPDGRNGVYYVNPETGERVNPEEYEIIDQYTAHLIELGLEPDPREIKKDKKKDEEDGEENEDTGPKWGDHGERHNMPTSSAAREASNNYGYMKKPGFLNMLGMIPDPKAQLLSKAIGLGINVNNNQAVNTARDMLGLENKTGFGGFVDNFKDNKGYIGDVSYNGVTSPVGFEAEDKLGRTTLTANEARMRQQLSQNFREAEDVEKAQSIGQFQAENPTSVSKGLGKAIAGTVAKGAIQGALGGNILGGVIGALAGSVKSYGLNIAGNYVSDAISNAIDGTKEVSREAVFGSPTGVNTRSVDDVAPGTSVGLTDGINQGISYSHPDRGPVDTNVSSRTMDTMNALAANTPGGINVSSAYRSAGVNAAVGGVGDSQHTHGTAFDVSIDGLNDQQKRDMVERAIMAGAMEIGTYANERKGIHIATDQRFGPLDSALTGGVTAQFNKSRMNYDQAPGWFKSGVEESQLAATPTARPEYSAPPGVETVGGVGTIDFNRAEQFTTTDKLGMAMTLAGEVDPSKTDLSTDLGQREAFGILSSIENRVGKYGSIEAAINAPNQYSTWNNAQAAATAKANYAANPDLYNGLVDSFTKNPAANLGFTSYYNSSIANPGWANAMTDVETIGSHQFGTVADYTGFGKNFGKTAMSQATEQATRDVAGVGASASATASINAGGWGSTTPSSSNTYGGLTGGFSSSVSGENANRSNGSTGVGMGGSTGTGNGPSGQGSTGSGSTHGFGGSSGGTSNGGRGSTGGFGGGPSGPGSTGPGSTHGFGGWGGSGGTGTSRGPSGPSGPSGPGGNNNSGGFGNKGDSNTSSGRLGGRV